MRGANPSQPVIPERAEDMPLHLLSPSPNVRSMLDGLQPLVIPPGFASLSRSDPPTPPGGPPPTPRRRAMNELSRSDPPTPPRGPPPTPGRHEADMFNSLSRCDPPSPPSGPPPSPRHSNGFGSFNSLSRRDPPTPPSGPPPSPRRRDIFNDLSGPTLPKGPPRRREASSGVYTGLSRSNPPSPPNGPPPTPGRFFSGYSTWTTDELDLLMFVCRSSVELVSQSCLTLAFAFTSPHHVLSYSDVNFGLVLTKNCSTGMAPNCRLVPWERCRRMQKKVPRNPALRGGPASRTGLR